MIQHPFAKFVTLLCSSALQYGKIMMHIYVHMHVRMCIATL